MPDVERDRGRLMVSPPKEGGGQGFCDGIVYALTLKIVTMGGKGCFKQNCSKWSDVV